MYVNIFNVYKICVKYMVMVFLLYFKRFINNLKLKYVKLGYFKDEKWFIVD